MPRTGRRLSLKQLLNRDEGPSKVAGTKAEHDNAPFSSNQDEQNKAKLWPTPAIAMSMNKMKSLIFHQQQQQHPQIHGSHEQQEIMRDDSASSSPLFSTAAGSRTTTGCRVTKSNTQDKNNLSKNPTLVASLAATAASSPKSKLVQLIENRSWRMASLHIKSRRGKKDVDLIDLYTLDLPLHVASWKGAPPELIYNLVHAHPYSAKQRNKYGALPIHEACGGGDGGGGSDSDVVTILGLTFPGGITSRLPPDDMLPIHCACARSGGLGVGATSERGASSNLLANTTIGTHHGTSSTRSLEHNNVLKIITYLLKQYPKGAAISDRYGRLPLHYVVIHASKPPSYHCEVVKALLKVYPFGVNKKDCYGLTPAYYAQAYSRDEALDSFQAGKGNPEVYFYLLKVAKWCAGRIPRLMNNPGPCRQGIPINKNDSIKKDKGGSSVSTISREESTFSLSVLSDKEASCTFCEEQLASDISNNSNNNNKSNYQGDNWDEDETAGGVLLVDMDDRIIRHVFRIPIYSETPKQDVYIS